MQNIFSVPDSGTPDESYEDIGKLPIIVLKYILMKENVAIKDRKGLFAFCHYISP